MYDETTIQPQYEQPQYQPPVYSGPPVDPEHRSGGKIALAVGACVVAILALVGAVLLTSHDRYSAAGFTQTAAGATTPTSVAPGTTNPASLAEAGASTSTVAPTTTAKAGGQAPASPAAPAAPKAPPAPAGPAPAITSFHTPDNIDCHNGNFQMFSASWSTTNAVKTTISIDGAGVYKTYGPSASDSLPFNCSSAHTFKLTAIGADGRTATKTITLQPRNVQPPQAPDSDD